MAGAQAEIDALQAEANSPVPESQDPASGQPALAPEGLPDVGSGGPGCSAPATLTFGAGNESIERILQIKVPLMVVLAQRKMAVREILNICIGSIIEFVKPFDEELELLVNNRSIAFGHAVKIGENFGLRIVRIGDVMTRIDALRKEV
jgi:flagellar motor switch protein FliN/FliY